MTISVEDLESVARTFLVAVGASDEEAGVVARSLVHAEMRGIQTHGINFLPKIAERIEGHVLNVPTRAVVLSRDGGTSHIDGNNGFGQVAATLGMEQAIDAASRYGIGMALIRNTNHIGLLASYSMMAAERDMIGFAACNSAPSVAPWGGTEAFFGTNPFSIAAPADGGVPIVLDMSTTVVARGRIRRALDRDEHIPRGWAFTPNGDETEDPAEAMRGTLMPIGGAKGYGMAFFIDLVCGLLSGSSFSRDVLTFHRPDGPTGVGVMVMAIDIGRFMPMSVFRSHVSHHVAAIRASKKAEGVERIYLPGEIEAIREMTARSEGITIDAKTIREIDAVFKKRGLSVRLGDVVSKGATGG